MDGRRNNGTMRRAAAALCAMAAMLGTAGCASAGQSAGAGAVAPPEPGQALDLFVGGDGRAGVYRIPALAVLPSGTLLAFAESRESLADNGLNSIVMRRSTDGGGSWTRVGNVVAEPTASLNNPCVTVVETGPHAGRVLLMFQRYPLGIGEDAVVAGVEGDRVCRCFIMHSDDEGRTWSAPTEITSQVRRATGATSAASGPGRGIQLTRGPHAGRIVVPFNEGPPGKWRVYSVFSDDGGDTWKLGLCAPNSSPGMGNECQVEQLADGTLLMVSRQEKGGGVRKVTRSRDGGATWGALVDEPALPCPSVMGGLVAMPPVEGATATRLVFTGPDSRKHRVDGCAWVSFDGGRTWPTKLPIFPGFFAYSQPVALAPDMVGVLFERDDYKAISFMRLRVPTTAPAPAPGGKEKRKGGTRIFESTGGKGAGTKDPATTP